MVGDSSGRWQCNTGCRGGSSSVGRLGDGRGGNSGAGRSGSDVRFIALTRFNCNDYSFCRMYVSTLRVIK